MRLLAGAAVLGLLSGPGSQTERARSAPGTFRASVDEGVISHRAERRLAGEVKSTANDHAVVAVVRAWADAFTRTQPGLRVSVEGRGALARSQGAKGATGPPALARGPHFGAAGWVLSSSERIQFEKERGYKPVEIRVGLGVHAERDKPHAIGVFVNAENPLAKATMPQVDAIFSRTRRRGYSRDVATWGDLGLKGEWAARSISIYSKNRDNVISAFFQQEVLEGGAFKDTLRERENSDAVVEAVSRDRFAVGFVGLAYASPRVKALALAENERGPYVEPGAASVAGASYPLVRYLYVVVDKAPGRPVEPEVGEFLRFILSREGQEVLVKEGYLPLPGRIVERERAKLDQGSIGGAAGPSGRVARMRW